MRNERYEKGIGTFKNLTGESNQKVVENIKSFYPDLSNMMIEFVFGDIYSRPKLKLKQKELITLTFR